ncbi:MAG: lipoprotein signal peptidase [Flavobacterium sp.]
MSLKKASLIIVLILLADQISKIYIKTHFRLYEEVVVFDWFKIYFVENNGMAWGTVIPGTYGKLFLTLFRIGAVGGIGYWLWTATKEKKSNYLITAIALIFAGALGNIIDSVFYGVIFNDSFHAPATIFSEKPYGELFYGNVVDMLYFPFIEDYILPSWLPVFGGKSFTFFNAIFNLADMAISTGVGILIFFNKRAFDETKVVA